MKRYSKYKDSGIEWLGEIPREWNPIRLKRIFNVVNGSTPKSSKSSYWNGQIVWITPNDLGKLRDIFFKDSERSISKEGYKSCGVTLAPEESIALSTRAPIGHLGIGKVEFCTNQGCRTLIKKEEKTQTLYFYYLLLCGKNELISYGKGSTFIELSKVDLENFMLCEPTKQQQQSILLYLRRKIGQINQLIQKKQKLIELLEEKRTAAINAAVTGKIDLRDWKPGMKESDLKPYPKYKPSGIEWIGEVPKYWDVISFKFGLEIPITDGPHETPEFLNNGIPFISAEAIKNDVIDFDKKRGYISIEDHKRFSKKYLPQYGDVFMVKSGATTGNVARVQTREEFNIWSPLAVLRPDKTITTTDFIFYYMKSTAFFNSVEINWSYGTQQNIGMNVIKNLKFLLPSLNEQEVITNFLNKTTQNIDDIINKIKIQIDFLEEYRTTLISNVVTGKIDVRNTNKKENNNADN